MLESARLTLRPVAVEDGAQLHHIFTQPGVRRVIFDNDVIPRERTTDIVERSIGLFRERAFGLWLAHLRTSNTIVGFGGLWFFRDPPELELLYGVADNHVGHGYGREIASAVVDYGFDRLKMPSIRASTDPQHAASRHVLEQLGFVQRWHAVVAGLDTVFYEITPLVRPQPDQRASPDARASSMRLPPQG